MNAAASTPHVRSTLSPSPDAMARRIVELENMVASLHDRFDRLRTYIWERHEALEVRGLRASDVACAERTAIFELASQLERGGHLPSDEESRSRRRNSFAAVEATLYELTQGKDTWKTAPVTPRPQSPWADPAAAAVAMSRHSVTPAYLHTPASVARQQPPPIWRTPVSTHATPTAVFSRMPSPVACHDPAVHGAPPTPMRSAATRVSVPAELAPARVPLMGPPPMRELSPMADALEATESLKRSRGADDVDGEPLVGLGIDAHSKRSRQ